MTSTCGRISILIAVKLQLLAFSGCFLANREFEEIGVYFAKDQRVYLLPILLNAKLEGTHEVYSDAIFALNIKSLSVDGKLLSPRLDKKTFVVNPAIDFLAKSRDTYIYMLPVVEGRSLRFAGDPDANGNLLSQKIYTIPEDWSSLVIEYKIRLPDGRQSRSYRLLVDRFDFGGKPVRSGRIGNRQTGVMGPNRRGRVT